MTSVTQGQPSLVPELLVMNTGRSIGFWCDLCGFTIDFQREEEGFAHISYGSAHVMLEQFLVSDPDGYLIRFQVSLGRRAIA